MQSSRVSATISRMVRTPRPSSPTRQPTAFWNSTSELALLRSPSLSLRRWMWMRLRRPSSRIFGSKKQVMPAGACANTSQASHIGADKNHLWPTSV